MDHMQPPRRLIGGQSPIRRSTDLIKPDRQVFKRCTAAIAINFKSADRTGFIIQNAGFGWQWLIFHKADIGANLCRSSDKVPRSLQAGA